MALVDELDEEDCKLDADDCAGAWELEAETLELLLVVLVAELDDANGLLLELLAMDGVLLMLADD